MRNGKGKRKLAESSFGSDSTRTTDDDNNTERFVWISNDNDDPRSPLTIECLTRRVEKKAPRVKLMKFGNKVTPIRRKRKDIRPETAFPFFIDKTPTRVVEMRPPKRRCTDLNDSVILIDSPSSSHNPNRVTRSSSRDSVDTVDLCSDSEDEGKKNRKEVGLNNETTNFTPKKSNQDVLNFGLPIVIDLDDEEESKNSATESTSSVIVESNGKSSSQSSQKVTASKSSDVEVASISLPHHPNPNAGPSVHLTESVPLLPQNRGKSSYVGSSTSSSTISTVAEAWSNFARPEPRKIPDAFIPNPRENISNNKSFERTAKNSDLSSVGSNVYNPNYNMEQIGPRPIIIDGCNVAIAHGGDREFSVRGLCICVDYFLRRGHTQVIAIVPLHQRCKVSHRDRDILESLRNDQHLVFTPSRFINNRLISSYDDRFIVQYAAAVGGVIVSRDNYRDLLDENPAWKDTILNRLLMPTWVGDMLMFPVDPLGKTGPNLDEFLQFPKK